MVAAGVTASTRMTAAEVVTATTTAAERMASATSKRGCHRRDYDLRRSRRNQAAAAGMPRLAVAASIGAAGGPAKP
jgi:hypothetical protein